MQSVLTQTQRRSAAKPQPKTTTDHGSVKSEQSVVKLFLGLLRLCLLASLRLFLSFHCIETACEISPRPYAVKHVHRIS
jgi:hypothetical protein